MSNHRSLHKAIFKWNFSFEDILPTCFIDILKLLFMCDLDTAVMITKRHHILEMHTNIFVDETNYEICLKRILERCL